MKSWSRRESQYVSRKVEKNVNNKTKTKKIRVNCEFIQDVLSLTYIVKLNLAKYQAKSRPKVQKITRVEKNTPKSGFDLRFYDMRVLQDI